MWGNSLALRIPKSFAIEVGLENNLEVDLSLVNGKLIVTPLMKSPFSLEALLADVTEENIHKEIDTGAAVGNEGWS